jgi:hypothetical protein
LVNQIIKDGTYYHISRTNQTILLVKCTNARILRGNRAHFIIIDVIVSKSSDLSRVLNRENSFNLRDLYTEYGSIRIIFE